MEKTKEKVSLKNKKIIVGVILATAIVITVILCILLSNNSNNLNLSDFEKIAVYGYLEDYLSLDELYLLSGKSSYDELHYTQSKIKNILDSYYNSTKETTISTSIINSELDKNYGISSDSIDYHGITVSDYEYIPEEQAFKRIEGTNNNMASSEVQVDAISNSDYKISVTNVKQISNVEYIVYFDVVDSQNKIFETGNVTIKIIDNSYSLETCTIN